MSRVVTRQRATALSVVAGLSLLALPVGAPAAAQDLPPCGDGRLYDCRLPDWSEAGAPDAPSLFGEVDGLVWLADETGDAPTGGIDIEGVGIGRVDVRGAGSIRKSEDLLRRGKPKKAVRNGQHLLVRIALDRPIELEDGHASIHVATDIDGSRGSNAPSGVNDPGNPFAGSQDVYSVTYASTTGKTRLFDSDLSRRWYKGKDVFAAAWATPQVLDLLIAPERFGADFQVVSHVNGSEGGFDVVSLGPSPIPTDGRTGLLPLCVEGSISMEPFTIRRLIDDGQRLDGVETRASWRGGAVFPVDADARAELEDLFFEFDEDQDGVATLPASIMLFEEGQVFHQRTDVNLGLDGDTAALWTELGLTRRGYDLIRDINVDPLGSDADDWFDRAEAALRDHLPPFRSTKKGGLLIGEGIGACIPALAPVPEPARAGPTDDLVAEGDA